MIYSGTIKVARELKLLPVRTKPFTDVTVNFVRPLPLSWVFDKLIPQADKCHMCADDSCKAQSVPHNLKVP